MSSLPTAGNIILGAVCALFFFFGVRFLLRRLRGILLVRKISTPLTILLIYFALLIFRLFYPVPIPPKLLLYIETFFLFLGIYLVMVFVETVVADYLLPRQRKVLPPALLRDIIRWALAVVVFFTLLKVMLQIDVTPVFFTSAAVTLVVGLAVQDLLSNLFSGITLHMERPFEIGDWVMAGSQVGVVANITWRATRIRTLDGDYVVIPNSKISKEEIINYHAPSKVHARRLKVGVSYDAPPNKVKDVVVAAALKTKGVLNNPSPSARLIDFGDFSITYEIKFWIDNYKRHMDIEDEVQTRIWYAFKRNRIEIPFPIRNVYMRSISKEDEETERDRLIAERVAAMRPIEILKPLTREELRRLALRVETQCYGRGEILARQGESGDSFLIIKDGRVEVLLKDTKGRSSVVSHLGRGDFFGEGSLLTGEPRSATVTAVEDTEVIVIDKSNFADILTRKPSICTSLSKILESRLEELAKERAALEKIPEEEVKVESCSVILKKIKNFFGL